MASRAVLGTWIRKKGYGQFKGEWISQSQIWFMRKFSSFEYDLNVWLTPFFFFLVRISRAIVRARDGILIVSTSQLAAIVTVAVRNVRTDKFSHQLHPAGRTFQALRWTNFSAL